MYHSVLNKRVLTRKELPLFVHHAKNNDQSVEIKREHLDEG